MADPELPDEVRAHAQRTWARYVDVLAPFRPAPLLPEAHGLPVA